MCHSLLQIKCLSQLSTQHSHIIYKDTPSYTHIHTLQSSTLIHFALSTAFQIIACPNVVCSGSVAVIVRFRFYLYCQNKCHLQTLSANVSIFGTLNDDTHIHANLLTHAAYGCFRFRFLFEFPRLGKSCSIDMCYTQISFNLIGCE